MSQEVHHNLEAITAVAMHHAKDHSCNYNIIVSNHLNGRYSRSYGSTYEYVADSYFNKERPGAIIIARTDDMVRTGCETMAEYQALPKEA